MEAAGGLSRLHFPPCGAEKEARPRVTMLGGEAVDDFQFILRHRHVDADGPRGLLPRGVDEDYNTATILTIGHDRLEGRRLRDRLAIVFDALQMQGKSLFGHTSRVVEVNARGNAAWEVRERHAEVAFGVLVDEGYILPHSLSQFDAGLPFDAFQRPDRDVALRVGTSDAPWLGGMLKLNMAAALGNLLPAIGLKRREDVPTVHF